MFILRALDTVITAHASSKPTPEDVVMLTEHVLFDRLAAAHPDAADAPSEELRAQAAATLAALAALMGSDEGLKDLAAMAPADAIELLRKLLKALLDAGSIDELRKLLDDDDMEIAVSVSETKVRFATPDIMLTSKVIDGTFPDYTRVIPQGNTRKLEVDASDFARAVDRVATVSSERSRAVKMALDEDRLVLSVNAPDSGAAEEELAVAYGDERLEIGFNAKYLLEIASQVDRENAVFMFNSAGDPTLMREGNDTSAVYVVMPMRV